jgi:outer membrane protein OmpA-like peptidoglycan-associated protein
MTNAEQDLSNARQMDIHQKEMKEEITYAREAVQTAEDARIETIRKIKARDEAALKAQQDAAQQQAEQAALAAQQKQQQAQAQAAQAQAQAQQSQQQAQQAQADADAARARQQAAEQAAQAAAQQTEAMREKLRDQLNQVLQTQETARGLIVNMSDVLFATNQYSLKPDAQIKLAKVSGILLTYPNIRVQVEGYTDNTGSDSYNLTLSQHRATSVQAFLIGQGVSPDAITSQGYGPADPVADNATSSGRAENRRVELVISGQSIGVQQQAPAQGTLQQPTQPQSVPAAQPANASGVSNVPQP